MAFSFTSLFEELGARRMRLRGLFGERTASIVEFVLFSGIVLGLFAIIAGEWRGAAPLVALIVGYVLLDVTRQRALAAGAEEEGVRKRQDRLAFILFAGMAVLGTGIFVAAMQPPPKAPAPAEEPYEAPPPSNLDLEIVE